MEKLWAPWRITYITKVIKGTRGCVFCKIFKEKNDKKNFIITRTKYSFSVLNIYPYNNGHVLIMPKRHVDDLSKLKREERDDLMDLLDFTKAHIDALMHPDGYNIGINLGKAAGELSADRDQHLVAVHRHTSSVHGEGLKREIHSLQAAWNDSGNPVVAGLAGETEIDQKVCR